MVIGELPRMDDIEPYQLEYDLKEKQFYVIFKNGGRISIHDLIFENHELHWKERKFVDSILKWLKENYPELLI
jgi:hypothetical protein